MKLLKWTLAFIGLLIVLFIGVLLVIDPNDYRDEITTQAKDKAGINLNINGDIAWSIFPLGLELNKVQLLDQNQQTFTQFNNLVLQVDTMSLIALQPNIHTLLLDGLDLKLLKDKQGAANWDNLIKKSEDSTQGGAAEAKTNDVTDSSSAADSSENKSPAMSFLVEEIRISNANIQYVDEQSDQLVAIQNTNLTITDIALGQAFPINLSFETQSNLIGKQTIKTELKTLLNVDIENESIALSEFELSSANLKLLADIIINQYTSTPEVNGKIALQPFAVNALLSQFGQATIPTNNPEALKQVGLKTELTLKGDALSLNDILIKLDTSSWKGNANVNLATQALQLALDGDAITIDDYLPPSSEQADPTTASNDAEAEAPSTQTNAAEAPLLPLETIRGLNLDIALTQASLNANKLKFSDMDIALTAKDGLVTLKKANTKLFEGNITSQASINAKTDDVAWKGKLGVKDLNILEQVGTTELYGWQLGGAGNINLAAEVNSLGNTLPALQQQAKGLLDLKINDGAITGINLNKLACEGFASLNRESITKTDWPNETKFNALEASVKIDGNLIDSPKLLIENIGLQANGQGKVNLKEQSLAYYLDINPIGNLGDEACRVREKVQGIAIPLKCEGSFDTAPAKLCGLNTKKLGRIAEKLLKKEAERKVEKEVDRAIEKKLNKYIDKDSELGKALKDGLKGLFR